MNINNIEKTKNVPNDNSEGKEKRKEKENVYNNENDSNRIFDKFEEPIVSLFENCYSKEPIREIRLTNFLFTHKLPSNKIKEQVEAYRRSNDEAERKKIKKSLKCITPSGTFSQRKEFSLINHSKLICIDIDAKDNRVFDLDKSKHIIGEYLPSLYYAGLSLGGEGIFLLFRISNPEFHKRHFDALAYRLNKKFGLNVDTVVKTPVSLRVVSYDENPYYNPNPEPFEHTMELNDKSAHNERTITERNEIRENVERAIKILWDKRIDITNRYENWLKIGFALAHEFGGEGRWWYHAISRMYEKYDEEDCDIQYNRCLKYKIEAKVTIATFFYYCKEHGIEYWKK